MTPDECKKCPTQQQLSLAHERLHELGRTQEMFLSVLSHELRTPVNGILGAGELLAMDSEDTKLVSLFRQSGQRILEFIKDIEILSRLCTGSIGNDRIPLAVILGMIPLESIPEPLPPNICVPGEKVLLSRAIRTLNTLFEIFQRQDLSPDLRTPPTAMMEENQIVIHYPLTLLRINENEITSFFDLECTARSASGAEGLGLAPAMAHRVVQCCGGTLNLQQINPGNGFMHLKLPLVTSK